VAERADGEATAETCTIVYDRDGAPVYGILFALLDDGRRAVAKSDDADVMAAMPADDFLGSRVRLRADGSFSPG
jgi:acetyl-CoA C-acetyltransferase